MAIQPINHDSATEEKPHLDHALTRLAATKNVWAKLPLPDKINLLQLTLQNLQAQAANWVALVNSAKRIAPDSPWAADEWYEVYVVAYALRGYLKTLKTLAQGKSPNVKRLRTKSDGQVVAGVFPDDHFDWLLFNGMSAEVWMQPDVSAENLADHMAAFYRQRDPQGKVALVLGAGNVSSIAPLDALDHLFVHGHVVLLKLSPVNAYLQPVLEAVFAVFIQAGYLAIISGDAAAGRYLTEHMAVDEIHLTGGIHTYNKIVYGDGFMRENVWQEGKRPLAKPITAELGGVTPVIVVPGQWSKADIQFQAENIVTMKLYNNGFNCIAAQVLVVSAAWPQRAALIDAIRQMMNTLPPMPSRYPGAAQRQQTVMTLYPQAEMLGGGEIPRTLIPQIDPAEVDTFGFCEEFFGPILAVVALPGKSEKEFLDNAVAFCNLQLTGTLGADMIVHPRSKRVLGPALEQAVAELRYGVVGVNLWCAIAYRMTQCAWGAYPINPGDEIISGNGFVHNTLMFDKPQKSVMRGSFYPFPRTWLHGDLAIMPKPPWFLSQKTRVSTAQQVGEFSMQPSWLRLPGIFAAALRG